MKAMDIEVMLEHQVELKRVGLKTEQRESFRCLYCNISYLAGVLGGEIQVVDYGGKTLALKVCGKCLDGLAELHIYNLQSEVDRLEANIGIGKAK